MEHTHTADLSSGIVVLLAGGAESGIGEARVCKEGCGQAYRFIFAACRGVGEAEATASVRRPATGSADGRESTASSSKAAKRLSATFSRPRAATTSANVAILVWAHEHTWHNRRR